MASGFRIFWREFKKRHPNFEQSKKFKSDVGPQFDKFDKALGEFFALQQAAEKKAAEIVAIGTSAAAALKGYEAVVKELDSSDKTIKADFKQFSEFEDTYVKMYAKKIAWPSP